jgi:hypothetical protein
MSQISDACGGGDGARALVPGTLRGYRTWRLLRRAPEDGALPLTSVTRGVRWAPTLTAECAPLEPGVDGLPEGAGAHRAPTAGCRCGIYGWYDPHDADILRARVFGVVQASGLVVMGSGASGPSGRRSPRSSPATGAWPGPASGPGWRSTGASGTCSPTSRPRT